MVNRHTSKTLLGTVLVYFKAVIKSADHLNIMDTTFLSLSRVIFLCLRINTLGSYNSVQPQSSWPLQRLHQTTLNKSNKMHVLHYIKLDTRKNLHRTMRQSRYSMFYTTQILYTTIRLPSPSLAHSPAATIPPPDTGERVHRFPRPPLQSVSFSFHFLGPTDRKNGRPSVSPLCPPFWQRRGIH